MDIRVPGMDGLTMQKRLVERGVRLPVVFVTGHGNVASAREAFRVLAIDFFENPLDQARLLEAISEAFSTQRD